MIDEFLLKITQEWTLGKWGFGFRYKLDVLGRFGWEVVSALGRIAGDQQLVLKRERREDRIEKERKILEKLSVILKAEKEQREAELEAYIDKLTKQIKKKVTDELVELDAKEKREKELSSGIKAKEKILPLLPKVGDVVCENTVIKDVKLTVTASIDSKDKLTYEGKIKINIDATKALLKNKNQYRQSEASKLSSKCEKEILSSIKGYKKKSLGGFSLSGNIQINYKGKATSVSSLYETFDIKPFPSYFSDRYWIAMELKIILTFIAGLITAYVTVWNAERKISIENITKERAKWRDKIRELSINVNAAMVESDNEKLSVLRNQFRLLLNPADKEDQYIIELLSLSEKEDNMKKANEFSVSCFRKHIFG